MNSRSWKVSRRIAAFLGALLAGLSIVWLTVLAVGVSIPLDAMRDSLERAVSESLGREARIGGSIALRPTLDAARLFAAGARPDTGATSLQRPAAEREAQGLVPHWLDSVAVDAGNSIRKLLHAPIPMNDAELTLSLRDGRLPRPSA